MVAFLMFFLLNPFTNDYDYSKKGFWKFFCNTIIVTLVQINFFLYYYNLWH